ncbi:YceI family protein [Changchengzhania lutea]|uniref:YceI family protein n=1 Tax=Changchengzhania lutea TaxID=2049305 RepID=UPI00115D2D1C|nr:YceI family protein [Changchengzhania lutea]
MKKVLIFISILVLLAFTTRDYFENTSVLITPESQLILKGKTNVNKFQCVFNVTEIKNPIPVYFKVLGDKLLFNNTQLVLKNGCFDCGNKAMNRDFQDLLKSKKYPQINLKLKELKELNTQKGHVMQVLLDLEIAGITKSYKIPVTLEGSDNLFVRGLLVLNICDFNIEPPKKLMGIISVDEIIEIDFQLLIEEC